MLDLEDIEILPESMPPPDTESAPVWIVVVAVVILAVIATLVVRALRSNAKKSTGNANPLQAAREELLRISESLSNPAIEQSFPTLIHAWANEQLAHSTSLPEKAVAEMTRARDLLAPHCYQPAARWRQQIDPDSILEPLVASLEVSTSNDRKGGQSDHA